MVAGFDMLLLTSQFYHGNPLGFPCNHFLLSQLTKNGEYKWN